MKTPKVFCLGFQKTGTSSLGLALEHFGYRVAGYYDFRHLGDKPNLTHEEITALAFSLAETHDAAQDTPWPILYRELDHRFPGSKFIHIIRDRNAWLDSTVNDFGHYPNEIHRLIYGTPFPRGHESVWLERYDRHNREVAEYFAGREGSFLSLHLNSGEVCWEKVCPFLGVDAPSVPWPHANTRRTKRVKLFWWRNRDRLRRWLVGS